MSAAKRIIAGGKFILDEPIGKGGVGEVWRATGATGGRQFAVKLLRNEYTQNPQLRRRFSREARAASRLSHPNLVTIYAFGADNDAELYIAMELAEGPTLAKAVRKGLSYRNILEVADRLLAGLAHAHARGVIHRDLKPDNVLLASARLPESIGTPKIVDFGIATVPYEAEMEVEVRDTDMGEVVGTPRYMSPEQAMGERNLGPRTDLYNVGLILYELVTGTPPFGDETGLAVMSRHVHEEVPQIVPRPGLVVQDEFIEVIMKAIEKRAVDRWSSAGEMRVALQPLLEFAREDQLSQRQPAAIERASDADSEPLTTPHARPDLVKQTLVETGAHPQIDVGLGALSYRIPFIGRDRERGRLRNIADQALAEGSGAIVLLEGEAGVGKSRLARWLREEMEEQGTFRANSGAFVRGGAESMRGLQEVVDSIFRTRGLPRVGVEEKIAKRLRDWGHDSPEDSRALTDFVRPRGAEEGRAAPSSSALFALLARLFELAASSTPRLVLLDDLHWAGREVVEFLEYLATEFRHRRIPMMIVATIRSEDLAQRPELEALVRNLSRHDGETVVRLEIDRLETVEGEDLVGRLLPCDDALRRIILERGGGNPLHILMLLRYLREEDLLEWVDGKWVPAQEGEIETVVPPSLGDLFRVRIEQAEARYDARDRLSKLLKLAGVLGFRFHYEVLRTFVKLSKLELLASNFETDLDRLIAEGFVVEVDGRNDWYAFSHGLLRDFLLREIGPAKTRRFHRLAAEAWESSLGGNIESHAFEIAQHWDAAQDDERALDWYLRAGESALHSFVPRQAIVAYERALGIMDAKLGISPDTQAPLGQQKSLADFATANVSAFDYLSVLSVIGDVREGFGEFDVAELAYRRVVRLTARDAGRLDARFVEPLGVSWLGLGHIAWQRGDFEAAEWAFRKVREIVKPYADGAMLDGQAARGLARVAWHRGEYDWADALAREAQESAERLGDVGGTAEALWLQGEIQRILGQPDRARAHYQRSLGIYKAARIPTGIARNLLSLAQVARYQKDTTGARDLYSRALAHYENLGDRRGEGMCQNGLGEVARINQQYEEAEFFYARALEIYEGIGAEYDIAVTLTNLGLNAIAVQDYDSAVGYLHAALAIVDAGDYPYVLAAIDYNLALVSALRGEVSEEEVSNILDLADEVEIFDIDYAQPLERLGEVIVASGRSEQAQALWRKALDIYVDLGLTEDEARVRRLISS